jgi:AmmeMemoRadiSam system protein A
MFDSSERQMLLRIARDAIAARLAGTTYTVPEVPSSLLRAGGAFVSLHRAGDLRGCIGRIDAPDPLAGVVAECAVSAAIRDPRFPPVSRDELRLLEIEVSILTPLERVNDVSEVEVGRHGLVVRQGFHSGLLLPQVATEWQWDRDTFLGQTCRKAGLPSDAWRAGAEIYRFEAEVFGEGPSHGESDNVENPI